MNEALWFIAAILALIAISLGFIVDYLGDIRDLYRTSLHKEKSS